MTDLRGNNMFMDLKQRTGDVLYVGMIRDWMRDHKVTFEELSFTEAELEAEEKKSAMSA